MAEQKTGAVTLEDTFISLPLLGSRYEDHSACSNYPAGKIWPRALNDHRGLWAIPQVSQGRLVLVDGRACCPLMHRMMNFPPRDMILAHLGGPKGVRRSFVSGHSWLEALPRRGVSLGE